MEFKVQGICGNKKEAWLLSFGSESPPYHVSSGGVSGMFQQQVLSGVPEEPAGSRLWPLLHQAPGEQEEGRDLMMHNSAKIIVI